MESRRDTRNPRDENRQNRIKKGLADKNKKKAGSLLTTVNSAQDGSEAQPPRPESPEPNCSICLEAISNKCFTDSCFHAFCFTCLVEWSKVKPQCPLCKQTFSSIVHNVKNDYSYDEYHVKQKRSRIWLHASEARYRYEASMLSFSVLHRGWDSIQDSYHNQIESHRMRFAPHSVRLISNNNMTHRQPCQFRNRVYSHNLWVVPASCHRVRANSPSFYRQNPACTHRLLPWLNRELYALLRENETQVTFVLELIMALIARYRITSQEFFIHIEPYLGDKTTHFIHEFNNFSVSPLSMEDYDRSSNYSGPQDTTQQGRSRLDQADSGGSSTSVSQSFTLPFELVFNNSDNRSSSSAGQSSTQPLKVIFKKNADNNWEPINCPQPHSSTSNPGPSTSRSATSTVTEEVATVSLSEEDEDECQVVQILKPKRERTPDIVELSSDEEVEQVVIDVPSDSDDSSSSVTHIPRTSPAEPRNLLGLLQETFTDSSLPSFPSYSPISPTYSPVSPYWPSSSGSSPWSTQDERRAHTNIGSDDSNTDIECVFPGLGGPTIPASSSIGDPVPESPDDLLVAISEANAPSAESRSGNLNNDDVKPKRKLSSAIVRPWEVPGQSTSTATVEIQDSLPSTSKKRSSKHKKRRSKDKPSSSKKRRRLSSGKAHHSSTKKASKSSRQEAAKESSNSVIKPSRIHTESDDDWDLPSSLRDQDSADSPKKLKLRSVIAHFSVGPEGLQSENYWKPKDRAKANGRFKHSQRIYSDSSSSSSSY